MSLVGRQVPFHQSIASGSCFRYYWSQSKVKAGSVDHHLILQLSSPGFLHQADQVIPLFETFERLTLSKNPTPSPRALGPVFWLCLLHFKPPSSPPCCGHTYVFPTTKSGPGQHFYSLCLGRFHLSPSNSWLLWVSIT